MIAELDAGAFEACVREGGVAVFPADTVYGLGCDPANRLAVTRLYLLKRRPLEKPSAVMFFSIEAALAGLGSDVGPRLRAAMEALLPGGVTFLVPNPNRRFLLACGADPGTLGVRVPDVPGLASVGVPVLQSSANRAGGADPRRLSEVPELLRAGSDLVLDGGELPGTSSTVVDLRGYEASGQWSVVRAGAVPEQRLFEVLGGQFQFHPGSYEASISEVPGYARLQEAVVGCSVGEAPVRRVLELGTGTGETAARLLERHPDATLIGVDASAAMLEVARERLRPWSERVELRVGRLEEPLPGGRFDLVASALAVHHLDHAGKADLFSRVYAAVAPGGRFVLGDVIVPEDPADATVPLTPGFDRPETVAEQLASLSEAGFDAKLVWLEGDLAVIAGLI